MPDTTTPKPPGALQLMLTMAGNDLFLEGTDGIFNHGEPLKLHAHDYHGMLRQVGQWHYSARLATVHATPVAAQEG